MKAKWEIYGDVLAIADEFGSRYDISADEMFNVVFNNISPEGYPSVTHPSECLPSFSRFPLELSIHLEKETGSPSGVALSFHARFREIDLQVPDLLTRLVDHIAYKGVWYPFVRGSLESIKKLLQDVGITQTGAITLRQYLKLKALKNNSILDLTTTLLDAEAYSECSPKIEYGKLFTGKLYGYQERGCAWLSFMTGQNIGCILADEMGLGKTIQIIAVITHRLSEKPYWKTLIVSPATLLANWRREISKFAPNLRASIHRGLHRTGFPSELKENDVILTSYETAMRDFYLLDMLGWDMVVLDEAQAIKNPDARRTKMINRLNKNVVVAVTGTPIQNNLLDMWSLVNTVLPGFLGNRQDFTSNYPPDSEKAARDLENFVSPLILRRKLVNVASDLPKRIDIPQYLELDPDSISRYEQIRNETMSQGPGASLAALTELRMFCTHPFLLNPTQKDPSKLNSKYCRLLEILEEIIGNREKVLIFTSFTGMIDILVKDLQSRFKIMVNKIDGRVDVEKRQPIIDHFNSFPHSAALILNPVAAGVGLNITGANHVIHYNTEWNPAIIDQATARVYRRGQTLPVRVHRLIYASTVEEVMDEILERKRRLAEQAVVGVDGTRVDHDDILRALQISPLKE